MNLHAGVLFFCAIHKNQPVRRIELETGDQTPVYASMFLL